jgi:hypothetical protein
MTVDVSVDGEPLPYNKFPVIFCNVTGHVVRLVHPFLQERQRETFYCLAYAIRPREFATLVPLIGQGFIPIDPQALIKPMSSWKQIGLAYFGKGTLPLDPRYINRTASRVELRTSEKVYTVDGEIFDSTGEPLTVSLGPTLRMAISA